MPNTIPVASLRDIAELRTPGGRLRPVTPADAALLTAWRNRSRTAFFSQFEATIPRTERWLEDQVLSAPDRVLFMIETDDHVPYGHIGFCRSGEDGTLEVDNMIRGVAGIQPMGMDRAARRLFAWAFDDLHCPRVEGRLFADNERSLRHHLRIGFHVVDQVPMRAITTGGELRWIEHPTGHLPTADRSMLRIELDPVDFVRDTSVTTSAFGTKPAF